ncbi:hypothetical protein [Leucothrix mucor]|uniref:hypothetical protein n=1 Tax=Leucothrix mucor TaxID=45248 RepID=UPI0003B30E09|nr:hypothetical protein [Leucothrix mucor]
MKTVMLMTLLAAVGINSASADLVNTRLNPNDVKDRYFIPVNTEVIAGRNMRVNGTNSCRITLTGRWTSNSENATAVIMLPNGARLLNVRIIESTPVVGRCAKTYSASAENAVQCQLSGIVRNQKITLQARYHQAIPNDGECSAYLGGGR